MQYRVLGRTGLKVSALCLGTMQFGWTTDEKAAREVLDAFVDAGGNFIDTADIYSNWADGNPGGVSEEIIGRWIRDRRNRAQIVLATKVRGRMWEGPDGEGLSRTHIMQAVEDSLRRLGMETIDLYQSHWYDEETPIEETLRALDDLVRQGKVRSIGASNLPAWRLVEALWSADVNNMVRYGSLQPHYNLVHRAEFERELKDVCEKYGVGVIPYSPLAAGFLTGKYRLDSAPDSARSGTIQRRYFNQRGWKTLEAVHKVAAAAGTTPTAVSLAWLLAQPMITAPIVGANSVEQLAASLAAVDATLSDEHLLCLDKASEWMNEA
jgi:aryl-alcohol dehydrogenase-like predicted oxidoreductase